MFKYKPITSAILLLAVMTARVAGQEDSPSEATLAALKSLPHGVYLLNEQGQWKKIEIGASSGFRTTHGSSSLVGVPPGVVRLYDGAESANQLRGQQPVFGIVVESSS